MLTHYFAAADDASAAIRATEPADPVEDDGPPGAASLDIVRLAGLEPFVRLGTLTSRLTGRSYGEVTRHPRHGTVVGSGGDDGPWVVTVSDELVRALAASTRTVLEGVVDDWPEPPARTGAEPQWPAAALHELAELCARARDTGHRVYCWACL